MRFERAIGPFKWAGRNTTDPFHVTRVVAWGTGAAPAAGRRARWVTARAVPRRGRPRRAGSPRSWPAPEGQTFSRRMTSMPTATATEKGAGHINPHWSHSRQCGLAVWPTVCGRLVAMGPWGGFCCGGGTKWMKRSAGRRAGGPSRARSACETSRAHYGVAARPAARPRLRRAAQLCRAAAARRWQGDASDAAVAGELMPWPESSRRSGTSGAARSCAWATAGAWSARRARGARIR